MPRKLHDDARVARWLHSAIRSGCSPTKARGYFLNLASGNPSWFVLWRIWSRRKAQARSGMLPKDEEVRPTQSAPVEAAVVPREQADGPHPSPLPPAGEGAGPPPTTLDDVAQPTPQSDFSRFVAREVARDVRNAALKKLLADPHFNVMDGLDIYIDDYGKPDPIPPRGARPAARTACRRA